ncbi:MAG: YibE/F family protein [Bacilli bacterium]|nr:YibE/F family protein [Bacilli bacterium]
MSKKRILLIALTILSILSIIFVYNDYFLYKNTILKVTDVKNDYKENNEYYTQHITGVIKNGEYKGKTFKVNNTAAKSKVYDDTIYKNNDIFVELSKDGKKIIAINDIKRDKYIVILLVLFIDLIFFITGKRGLKTLISLLVNIIISTISIFVVSKFQNFNILVLYILVSILFISLSLFITNGKSRKTLAAIISSIVSLFTSFSLVFILIKFFGDHLSIWTMEYIEIIYDYQNYFYVSILLCGLGAIMDISITITSALSELIEKNPKIKTKDLKKSGREISKDIIGTMTNVMLFTCFSSVIPMMLLALKNNVLLSDAISLYGELELVIVLSSCISIVLAIPISLYISLLILHRNKRKVK